MLSKMKSVNERVVYPNIYGSVSGYEVGTVFARRRDFKRIHTSKDAIACGPEGPFSILMLKNKNFLDDGHRIMLTSGEMESRNYEDIEGPLNQTLLTGLRSKLPIRVIRSSFIGSIYAPKKGYRYDGLYQLEECQTILVDEKHIAFKFLMVRLQRQLAVPWEDETSANATRFSADDETLEITGEPCEMDSEEINDSRVHLNGFQVEDTFFSLLESSHVKVEDSEVESVTVKREAAEPLKRELTNPQDGKTSPYRDAQMCQSKVYRGLRFFVDQLSLSVSDNEELSTAVKMAARMYDGAILKPVTDGTESESEVCAEESSSNCERSDQTLKSHSTAENCYIAKDEVDIEDNLSIKREPRLKPVDEIMSNGAVSVLNNGFAVSTEIGDNDLGGVNKINDYVKSGEFSDHDDEFSTSKHLPNPYASSDMEVRANDEDISTPLSTPHPNNENSSFHVIAAVDQLFGTKNVAVASKYVDILSTASERKNKAIVSPVVPCRSTPQSYAQDHRGANIISGISTLDFDGGQFIVNKVNDSIMPDEANSREWWLMSEKRQRMLLEARLAQCPTSPSLKMETNNFSSTLERPYLSSRIMEENDCLASQLPPSPSYSLIDVSSFHSSHRPLSPPLMIMEGNSSLASERTYSPSQVKVETNGTSTNQHVFTPQAIMEASSSTTPKQPPRSVPSIYKNLRSSNRKDYYKDKLEKGLNEKCLKCLPPTNLLKSILGKHSVQFHSFYSQYFCQCDNIKQPCSYEKMHSFILQLSKKDPKYLTAILTYLLYGQFEKPDVSSKFYSLCESSLNDESKNDNLVHQCKCKYSDPESVKISSGVLRKNKNAGSFIKSMSVARDLREDRSTDVSSTSATLTRASRRQGRKRKCDDDPSHPTHELLDVIPPLPAKFHLSFDDLPNKVKHVKSFKPSSTSKSRSFKVTPAMNDEFPKSPPFHGFHPNEVEIGKNFGNIWLESISPFVPFQGFEVPKRKRSENRSRMYDRWFSAKFLDLET